jgi:hypothetical protein
MSTLNVPEEHDHIIEESCREVVGAIRLGRKIGAPVLTAALAASLQIAAYEWEKAVNDD